MASLDGLYEFTNRRSFDDYLVAFLEHALLPILEYTTHGSDRPNNLCNLVIPTKKRFKYVKFKTCDHDLSIQSDLEPILTSLLGAKPFPCNLWQASIEIDVPWDPNHEFWSRKGLKSGDGKYQDAISTTIVAFGSSEDEAKGIVLLKLTTFLDMCREQIWPTSSSLNQSEYPRVDFEIDAALWMGMDLLRIYKDFKFRISKKSPQTDAWDEIVTILHNYSKQHPHLEPLIMFYGTFSPLTPLSSYPFFLFSISNTYQGLP